MCSSRFAPQVHWSHPGRTKDGTKEVVWSKEMHAPPYVTPEVLQTVPFLFDAFPFAAGATHHFV